MNKTVDAQSLNPSQREAVQHMEGPLLMLAGPGSGKTRVITHRVGMLLENGIPASQILALTFTNKAADEMQRRVEQIAPGQRIWMGTFHRFCARLLREYAPLVGLHENYSICDTDDSRKALKQIITDEKIDLGMITPQRIAAEISRAKSRLISPSQYVPAAGSPIGAIVATLYPVYAERMLKANAVDFDDLLLHFATILQENPQLRHELDERYRYIMVDEYQDTNLAQYTIVRGLSIDYPNLAVTGDPDQSIYGWRGANLNNIMNFERDYDDVRVIRLEQNYRSTPNILRVADQLISHNVTRKHKQLFTENPTGLDVKLVSYPHSHDEADMIAGRIAADIQSGRRNAQDFAIFFRINALTRQFERALNNLGIPYQIVNGLEFYQRKEIKDVIAFLHLINNPRNEVALLRIINTPPRGIGKTTIQRLCDYAHQHRIPLLEALRMAGSIETLKKRAATAVAKFVAILDRIAVHTSAPIEELIGHILTETQYREFLQASDLELDQERGANVDELLNDAGEFDQMYDEVDRVERFLERVSLVADTDQWESTSDVVTLMTLHSAKGLEFPVVFIVAVEQGMLPHERSKDNQQQLEEERRLLFVGITRAEEELQLSMANYRDFRGGQRMAVASEFLMELPREEMDCHFPNHGWAAATEDDSFDFESFDAFDGIDEAPDDTQVADVPAIDGLKISTAAELLGEAEHLERVDPRVFEHGMMVKHPEYGTGRIVALSGKNRRRTATVDFGDQGQTRIILAYSNMRPLKSE